MFFLHLGLALEDMDELFERGSPRRPFVPTGRTTIAGVAEKPDVDQIETKNKVA